MLADKKLVTKLIPQDSPMIMVDELLTNNDKETVSCLLISNENIFCSNGIFNEPGLVENIAQTAALRSGYKSFTEGKEPPVGFIGSIKKMEIFDMPKSGNIITTKVKVMSELMNAMVMEGEIFIGEKLIAKGTLNIFLQ